MLRVSRGGVAMPAPFPFWWELGGELGRPAKCVATALVCDIGDFSTAFLADTRDFIFENPDKIFFLVVAFLTGVVRSVHSSSSSCSSADELELEVEELLDEAAAAGGLVGVLVGVLGIGEIFIPSILSRGSGSFLSAFRLLG